MPEENQQNNEQHSLNKIHFQIEVNEDRRAQPGLLALIGRGFLWGCLILFGIVFALFAVCSTLLMWGKI